MGSELRVMVEAASSEPGPEAKRRADLRLGVIVVVSGPARLFRDD